MTFAPICVFAFNRPECLRNTMRSLRMNQLAKFSDLYVFSDGPRPSNQTDLENIRLVREEIRRIEGFKSIHLRLSEFNRGLADSIINGVSEVIQQHKNAIVLEDDLMLSENFLDFMNEALRQYEGNRNIFSVSGFSHPIRTPLYSDVYFTHRASSWGWATWQDRWEAIDWSVKGYSSFSKNKKCRKEFNKMGSDMARMLRLQMENKIDSWAIRWTFHQYQHKLYTVFPKVSKVVNEGFSGNATHTSVVHNKRFATVLDTDRNNEFRFDPVPVLNPGILKEFTRPYSIPVRILYKLKSFFS